MSKQTLHIVLFLFLILSSCRNYICPAYESAFNRGTTPYDKYFSFLPNDTLPRDERMLMSPKYFDYFEKDSAYVPVGEYYMDDEQDSLLSKSKKATSFVKNIFVDNREKKFRIGEGKVAKKGIQKNRIEDLIAYYTPVKGRKNVQRRNHPNVIRSFPTLPLPEIVEIDTPVIDEVDEPFLVVDEDSLLLDLQPEDTTTLVASNDKEKIDPFPAKGFDQWYYEQEFGYLLYKDTVQEAALDTVDIELQDSLALNEPEQKGIKGLFSKIKGKFKKKKKDTEIDSLNTDGELQDINLDDDELQDDDLIDVDQPVKKKKKKKKKIKLPFKKKKKEKDEDVIEDEDDVFEDDDLEGLEDDDTGVDDDDGGG